jgi:multiple sugar transport system permease protein
MSAKRDRLGGLLSTSLSLVFLSFFLFPIYWMVVSSFRSKAEIFHYPPQIIPTSIDTSVWTNRILFDHGIVQYIANSMVVATGTMALTLFLSVPAAFAIAQLPVRGKSVILLISLTTLMFPSIMLALPLFLIFTRLGLTDSFAGLIVADTTIALPFSIVLLRPFLAAIPKELIEAAQIDGCSLINAFLRIVVPIAIPGIFTAGIFSFLFGWGDLVFALSLTDDDAVRPITAGLWAFFGANTSDWAGAMAFSTLAMLPPLVVFLFTQRHVVAGLTAGSLKG